MSRRNPSCLQIGALQGLLLLTLAAAASATLPLPGPPQLFGAAHSGPDTLSVLYRINPSTGTTTFIGSIGFNNVGAMDFDPKTGILYGTGKRPKDGVLVLITIDKFTGNGTEIGPLVNVVPESNGFDMSFGNTDGVLYLTSVSDPCVSLFSVDTTTGEATEIGDSKTCDGGNALAMDGVDNGYLINDAESGILYSVDQTTGAASPTAPLSFIGFPKLGMIPRVNAMEISREFNFVSVNAGNEGSGPNFLGTIELRESAPGPVGPTPGEVVEGVSLGAIFNTGQTVNGLDALAALPAPRLFGAAHSGGNSPSTLYQLDVYSGSAIPLGAIGFNAVSAMDFNPWSGILYGTGKRPKDGEPVLIQIDPFSGAGTEIGPLVNTTFGSGHDISFRNSDGVLFLVEGGKACPSLYTVDLASGLATLVGSTETCSPGNGLAIDLDDTLYHSDEGAGGTLYITDQNTGLSTADVRLNYLGFPKLGGPRLNAMEFVPGFNFVSVNDGNSGSGPNYLATVFIDPGAPGAPSRDGASSGGPPPAPLHGDVHAIGQTVNGLDALAVMPSYFVYGAAHLAFDGASTLYRIDPDTGTANDIGPIGFDNVIGLDFEPASGRLFAVGERSGDGMPVTIRIDPITGQGFEIGPLLNADFDPNDHDMSFRNSDASLFLAAFGSSCIDLFGVATSSGIATEIGSTTTCNPGNALGFDVHDNLFLIDEGGFKRGDGIPTFGNLYSVNPATGTAAPIASLSYFAFPFLVSPSIDSMELGPGLQLVTVNDFMIIEGGGFPESEIEYLATIATTSGLLGPRDEADGAPFGSPGDVLFIGQTVDNLDAITSVTEATDGQIGNGLIFADGFESGDVSEWSSAVP